MPTACGFLARTARCRGSGLWVLGGRSCRTASAFRRASRFGIFRLVNRFAPGTTIGTYRLDHQIGEGGMGTVYRAMDMKLNRAVAIKFVSSDLAAPSARQRFQREAQLASSLNHPHILTVYDTGESDGQQYIVSELVDGGTLRDWFRASPRSWQDVVELVIGVADGLATAHEAGILHRDVKPENVLITKSGYAKLADFGLAKLRESPSVVADAPTELRTRPGIVVGTIAYMSPEQASGQPVDARSDVFSFAVVLYELLGGRRPFRGSTDLEVLHAIAHQTADRLPESIPQPLRDLIERALRKAPAERVQTMREVVADLRRLARESGATSIAAPQHRGRTIAWAAAAIAAVALVAVSAVLRMQRPAPAAPVATEYIQLTNFADSATSPALSPDGRLLAFIRGPSTFAGPGQVYVKRLPDGEPRQLTNDNVPKMDPRFLPDGARISYSTGFAADNASMDAWVVAVDGGPPQKILTNAVGLSWFTDRAGQPRVLFSEMTGLGGQMSIVSSTERRTAPQNVYVPPPPAGMAHRSYRSPDGQWVLVVEMDVKSWLPCRLVPFDGSSTGKPVGPIPAQCTDAGWSPDGAWMYFTAMTASGVHIWRQRFAGGAPEQLTFGAGTEEGAYFAPDGRSFVTSVGTSQSTLWVHDSRGDRQITSEGHGFMPALSADGKKLYYLIRSYGLRSWNQGGLWVAGLETGQRQRLLADVQLLHYSISADGRRLVFVSVDEQGRSPVWLASLDGQRPPKQLSTIDASAAFFGAPGEVLFAGQDDLHVYRVKEDGSELQKVVSKPLLPLAVSPNGEWIAVQDPAVWGALTVYPAGAGSPQQLCDKCLPPWGTEPTPFFLGWTPDSHFVYWNFTDAMYAIPLQPGRMLPRIPAGGIQSKERVAALPGARLISEQNRSVPGPNPSLYAFVKVSTQRNIYRIPVP
jgi:eukaryotic-like serine/threonine-protein kinase